MDTKSILLFILHHANELTDHHLEGTFKLMKNAVQRISSEEIDWHLMNGLSDEDILLLLLLHDTDLSVQYRPSHIEEMVRLIVELGNSYQLEPKTYTLH
ncbi:hypothetical protein C9980_25260 [Vibrio mediterranei]|uniref:hypothetical protein n=1 Tax=Vibrio mediterranei TaxID=689 RepID=UPI000D182D9A|nr:hypothetical protein [Vibrio mediterranei]PTC02009.1 hypothetical protein C9980_25260 [Vibrio mediterranei]